MKIITKILKIFNFQVKVVPLEPLVGPTTSGNVMNHKKQGITFDKRTFG